MTTLRILCNDGSPLGVTSRDIYGEGRRGIGIGGAEIGLLTMCEAWHKAGYKVVLYNDPTDFDFSVFEQRNVSDFNANEKFDITIIFRTPNPKIHDVKGLKVWWSTDQYTSVPFKDFNNSVDRTVCISQNHADYFVHNYGIHGVQVIDLPVRLHDYEQEIPKIPYRLLFSSVPDRGLLQMREAWLEIHKTYPQATLVVTSDFRLWGLNNPNNANYRLKMARVPNVIFHGALKRREFNKVQLESMLLSYPCTYDELFCISVAEAQVAGAYPVTSGAGSLPTTNMGWVVPGDYNSPNYPKQFAKHVIEKLDDLDGLKSAASALRREAIGRFDPMRLVKEWEEKVFSYQKKSEKS